MVITFRFHLEKIIMKTRTGREAELLDASLKAAEQHGYNRVTLQQIADAAGVSKQTPITYFGTMAKWRRKVMRHAVEKRCLRVIAQGIVMRDPHALKAPAEIQAEALAILAN